ncbi:HAMP domain-containing sensor histidine kinase [Parablautia muri]|uniref:histidine kinase n=1 Tax=Parablautia muri TaxID=2320879 RepID=A0A9X5BIW8_9FIRM|nr:HAMP domain-containing sensor histidine kinase [Parablautia muri]NBJ94790.1 sensor histidine kinase [Parablautia muri]
MDKLRNLSIRKSIILYIFISLIVSLFLWGTAYGAAAFGVKLYSAREISDDSVYYDGDLSVRPDLYIGSEQGRFLLELCDFILVYGFLIFSVPGIVIAVLLFYRNKIQKPLQELKAASKQIEENNLDFHISYENHDELGQLCAEFEKMRKELESNNRKMWRMVEAEKILRAAIAHDIRTPLATLRGYQETMLEFLPESVLSQEKMEEMLREGMGQIDRINRFVENMRVLSGLESREAVWERTSLKQLEAKLRMSAGVLEAEYGRNVTFIAADADKEFQADAGVVLEVAENLISNALRFANENVLVSFIIDEDSLTLEVADDGKGFSLQEDIHQTGRLDQQPDLQHLGIGLYISRICCEKHGGKLTVENRSEGGGMARATFQMK